MKKARGYEQAFQVMIDRRKHRVYLNNKTTALELIKGIEEMPEDATFEEFEWFSEDEHYIEFHSEAIAKDPS